MKIRLVAGAAVVVSFGIAIIADARGPVQSDNTWFSEGQESVESAKALNRAQKTRAKNVILFVGDGMGVSTVTAARIFEGQQRGETGEENLLFFESFPNVALAKTYNTNQQTPDSAGTMTAMVGGVKTKAGVLSVDDTVVRGDHSTVRQVKTLFEKAEERGLATGIVTTARLTHATPAACYAHSPERDWENDTDVNDAARGDDFPDIARQLIEFPFGDGLEVALGGGRQNFLASTQADPEDAGATGRRGDGRDLTVEWAARPKSAFVWNQEQFDAADPDTTDHLLGLFERSHMEYELDRGGDTGGEPSLSEMTQKALQVLEKDRDGFVLHVESGRIDHAHHAGNAHRALADAVEFASAVRTAYEMTDPDETLILVTADHSHVFTIAGYPTRGNDILGKVVTNDNHGSPEDDFATDALGLPYTTLGYANGPGWREPSDNDGRPDLTDVNTTDIEYLQEATVPMESETHSGEDVAIYATGPGSQLVRGVVEQNVVYHVMAEALRLDSPRRRAPHGVLAGLWTRWFGHH